MATGSRSRATDDLYRPSGFFVLRTPLLPFDVLENLAQDPQTPRPTQEEDDDTSLQQSTPRDATSFQERLLNLVTRPEVREALFVASPSFYESVQRWIAEPNAPGLKKVVEKIVAYCYRLAGRPTPFGLFAGWSVGELNRHTAFQLSPLAGYRRTTSLDGEYLFKLADELSGLFARSGISYKPQSSLYRLGDHFRYIDAALQVGHPTNRLVSVALTDYLHHILTTAAAGARIADLATALIQLYPEGSTTEADEFISELIASHVLVSDLIPPITGCNPAVAFTEQLAAIPEAGVIASTLRTVLDQLISMDRSGLGVSPNVYTRVARDLATLPTPPELAKLYQVNLMKPVTDLSLGDWPVKEIQKGVRVLNWLALPARLSDLHRFRDAFLERFGDREVRLAEALDEDMGIPFGPPSLDPSPLLRGFPEAAHLIDEGGRWGPREQLLAGKIQEALTNESWEIRLDEHECERLTSRPGPSLPDAFSVTAELVAESSEAVNRGEFRVLIGGCWGPSGARLLGRFCQDSQMLQDRVKEHLQAEEALDPEAVFAEIVYLSKGRSANVVSRPVLRSYEIPFLGRSGAPLDKQIPVDDLLLSYRNGQLVLRSAQLNRRVVPRLTTAHHFNQPAFPAVYRFLCALQGQDLRHTLRWQWGGLETAAFLPRVVVGRAVLSRATWRAYRSELQHVLNMDSDSRCRAVHAWRLRRHLPRFVLFSDDVARTELLIDLDNVASLNTFASLIKTRPEVLLTEMYPAPNELCVVGPEGRFIHELIVPFVRCNPRYSISTRISASAVSAIPRSFPPGSEWIYLKLYCGDATADGVISALARDLLDDALKIGLADLWFFVRFCDPHRHLRIRIHGSPDRLMALRQRVDDASADLMRRGTVWRIQTDTYERELERYGGPHGAILSERLFWIDSETVVETIRLDGMEQSLLRSHLAIKGIDTLLSDLSFSLADRRQLLQRMRKSLDETCAVDARVKRQCGRTFLAQRDVLKSLLNRDAHSDQMLAGGISLLERRSRRLAPLIAELRRGLSDGHVSVTVTALAASYVHMYVNRLCRLTSPMHELVLCDMLYRLYDADYKRTPSDLLKHN